MKVLFDTNIIVVAMLETHPNHAVKEVRSLVEPVEAGASEGRYQVEPGNESK